MADTNGYERASDSEDVAVNEAEAFLDASKGVGAGFLMEIVFCTCATFIFSATLSRWMWITFGLCLFIRCVLLCLVFWGDLNARGSSKQIVMWFFLASTLFFMFMNPFLPYALISNWGLVHDCEVVEYQKNITTYTGGTVDSVWNAKIECANQSKWLPISILFIFPLIVQIGIPLLFGFLFVNASDLFFKVNLQKSSTLFKIAILNFADIAGLISLPFKVSAHLFFDANPMWFQAGVIAISVAWLAATVMVSGGLLQSLHQSFYDYFADGKVTMLIDMIKSDRFLSFQSFFFINLIFGLFRSYMILCAVEVSYIFLAKNFMCGLYDLAILCGCKSVAGALSGIVDMIPGADKVEQKRLKQQAARERFRREKQESAMSELADDRADMEAQMKIVAKEAREHEIDRIRSTIGILDLAQEIVFRKPTGKDLEEKKDQIRTNFRKFAPKSSGVETLTVDQIKESFGLLGKETEDMGDNFVAFMKRKDKDADDDDEKLFDKSNRIDVEKVADEFIEFARKEIDSDSD